MKRQLTPASTLTGRGLPGSIADRLIVDCLQTCSGDQTHNIQSCVALTHDIPSAVSGRNGGYARIAAN
jgi:hypothetical protein